MRAKIFIPLIAALICGCSKQKETTFDSTLVWHDLDGKPEIHIFGKGISTNIPVSGLDDAMSVANRYGWKFVSAEHDKSSQTYHIQKIADSDSETISIVQ